MRNEMKKILLSAALAAIVAGSASCTQTQAPASSSAPGETSAESTVISAGEAESEDSSKDAAASSSEEWNWDSPAGEQTEAVVIDPSTADYSKIDITIEPDSGEEIVNFTNDMLAGKYDGKIVKCTGETGRRMFGNAMMQKQADGSSRGFTWILSDTDSPDAYPPDDAVAEITGIVGIGEYDVRYLYVPAANVRIIAPDGEENAVTSDETAASAVTTAYEKVSKAGSYDELRMLVEAYYSGNHDGYVPSQIDLEPQEDGTLAIHLYDIVDDHTATVEWYYIDPWTLKGTDFAGNAINMDMSAGSASDMLGWQEGTITPAPWSPAVIQRQLLLDHDEFFGVRYLGWVDPSITDLNEKVRDILKSTGTAEDFEFTADMPADRFVSTADGQELYLVIPFDEAGTVSVVPQSEPGGYIGEVDFLYHSEDGEPFLLKCNVSEIYPDAKVIFTDSKGDHAEWYPGLSGKDGTVITSNDTNKKVHDFTDYGNISGYSPAVG